MNNFDRHAYRYLSVAAVTLLVGGTLFYHTVEKFSWVNSYFFCVTTLTTVGYGNIVPKTDFGKIFTTFYIMGGVGIIAAFITTSVQRRGLKFSERMEKRAASSTKNPPKNDQK